MSWLSSEELRECEPPAAAAGRRGNSGAASCPDDDDVVETTFLSPAENADESWPADGGGGNCDGPDTVAQHTSK